MACYSLLIYFISFFSLFADDVLFAVNMLSTASQLFLNCWMRATASIVRAKRFYSDGMVNNLVEYSLPLFIICASFSPSFHLLLFFFFSLLSLDILSSYTGSFRLQSETALPVHCYDRFMELLVFPSENWWFWYFKVSHLGPRLWVTF